MQWIYSYFHDDVIKKYCKSLARGQLISLLIAATGMFASLLSMSNVNFPEFMSFCMYSLLAIVYLRRWLIRPGNSFFSITFKEWKWYIVIVILDVEANFMITEAYNYTSITSIMLLDCFAIPFAMLLSYIFVNARYQKLHLFGAVICLLGMGCTIASDAISNSNNQSSKFKYYIVGDLLTIAAASFYAACNVFEEKMLKTGNRDQLLGIMGLLGSIITLIQALSLELNGLRASRMNAADVFCFFGFVLSLFLMYANTSLFLKENDSVVFNLSILTSDVYSVIFAFFAYGYVVNYLYYLAFILSATGLFIYHSIQSPVPANLAPNQLPSSRMSISTSSSQIDKDEISDDQNLDVIKIDMIKNNSSSDSNRNKDGKVEYAYNPILLAQTSINV